VHPVWLFAWMHTLLAFQCSSVQALGRYVVEHRRQKGDARVVRGARGGGAQAYGSLGPGAGGFQPGRGGPPGRENLVGTKHVG